MILDAVLALGLLIAVPAWGLTRARHREAQDRTTRYRRAIGLAALLLTVLALDWRVAERSPALLGLALPPNPAGWAGLGVAVLVVAGMAFAIRRRPRTADGEVEQAALALLPRTAGERGWFVVFAFVIGFAWEVLFRGFLLWFLTPFIGIAGAVLAAAAAYGLAHGVKSARQVGGSLLAALLFTSAYAVSGSLWWLIVIHIALPLIGAAAMRSPMAGEPSQRGVG